MLYFVVRIQEDDEIFDFKVFETKSSAVQHLNANRPRLVDNEIDEMAAFRVEADDLRLAASKVKSGETRGVGFLKSWQSPDYSTKLAVRDLDFEDFLLEIGDEK